MSELAQSGPIVLGVDGSQPLVLGPLSSITGIIQYHGTIVVEGSYEADIRCATLIIGPTAELEGVVVADRVEIAGKARGEIYAGEIMLQPSAHVEAELIFTSLALDVGAYFEGRSRQHPSPTMLGPRFPAMRGERAAPAVHPPQTAFRQAAE
jgi:cytoskeletal protein CcmA (bactofilin family)